MVCVNERQFRYQRLSEIKGMIDERLTFRKEALLADEIPQIPNVKRSKKELSRSPVYNRTKTSIPSRLNKIVLKKARQVAANRSSIDETITDPISNSIDNTITSVYSSTDSNQAFGFYKQRCRRLSTTISDLTCKLRETRKLLDVLQESENRKAQSGSDKKPVRRKIELDNNDDKARESPKIADFLSASFTTDQKDISTRISPLERIHKLKEHHQPAVIMKPDKQNQAPVNRKISSKFCRSPRSIDLPEYIHKSIDDEHDDEEGTGTDNSELAELQRNMEQAASPYGGRSTNHDTLSEVSDPFTDSDFMGDNLNEEIDVTDSEEQDSDNFSMCSEQISHLEARDMLSRSEKMFSMIMDNFERKNSEDSFMENERQMATIKDSEDSFLENERLTKLQLRDLDDLLSEPSSIEDLRFNKLELPILQQSNDSNSNVLTEDSDLRSIRSAKLQPARPSLKFGKLDQEELCENIAKPTPIKPNTTANSASTTKTEDLLLDSYENDLQQIDDILAKYDEYRKDQDVKKSPPRTKIANPAIALIAPWKSKTLQSDVKPTKPESVGLIKRKISDGILVGSSKVKTTNVVSASKQIESEKSTRKDIKSGIASGITKTKITKTPLILNKKPSKATHSSITSVQKAKPGTQKTLIPKVNTAVSKPLGKSSGISPPSKPVVAKKPVKSTDKIKVSQAKLSPQKLHAKHAKVSPISSTKIKDITKSTGTVQNIKNVQPLETSNVKSFTMSPKTFSTEKPGISCKPTFAITPSTKPGMTPPKLDSGMFPSKSPLGLSPPKSPSAIPSPKSPPGIISSRSPSGIPSPRSPLAIPSPRSQLEKPSQKSTSGMIRPKSPKGKPSPKSPIGIPSPKSPSGMLIRKSPKGTPSPSPKSPNGTPSPESPSGLLTCKTSKGTPSTKSPNGIPTQKSPSGISSPKFPSGISLSKSSSGKAAPKSQSAISTPKTASIKVLPSKLSPSKLSPPKLIKSIASASKGSPSQLSHTEKGKEAKSPVSESAKSLKSKVSKESRKTENENPKRKASVNDLACDFTIHVNEHSSPQKPPKTFIAKPSPPRRRNSKPTLISPKRIVAASPNKITSPSSTKKSNDADHSDVKTVPTKPSKSLKPSSSPLKSNPKENISLNKTGDIGSSKTPTSNLKGNATKNKKKVSPTKTISSGISPPKLKMSSPITKKDLSNTTHSKSNTKHVLVAGTNPLSSTEKTITKSKPKTTIPTKLDSPVKELHSIPITSIQATNVNDGVKRSFAIKPLSDKNTKNASKITSKETSPKKEAAATTLVKQKRVEHIAKDIVMKPNLAAKPLVAKKPVVTKSSVAKIPVVPNSTVPKKSNPSNSKISTIPKPKIVVKR